MPDRIEVENANHPGHITRVNAEKYRAMREALLASLPVGAPPISFRELRAALGPHPSDAHFPGGATAGWWLKTVQLDLEAKDLLKRHGGRPMRLSRLK